MFVPSILFSRSLQVRAEIGALATSVSLPKCRSEIQKMRPQRRDPTEVDSTLFRDCARKSGPCGAVLLATMALIIRRSQDEVHKLLQALKIRA